MDPLPLCSDIVDLFRLFDRCGGAKVNHNMRSIGLSTIFQVRTPVLGVV